MFFFMKIFQQRVVKKHKNQNKEILSKFVENIGFSKIYSFKQTHKINSLYFLMNWVENRNNLEGKFKAKLIPYCHHCFFGRKNHPSNDIVLAPTLYHLKKHQLFMNSKNQNLKKRKTKKQSDLIIGNQQNCVKKRVFLVQNITPTKQKKILSCTIKNLSSFKTTESIVSLQDEDIRNSQLMSDCSYQSISFQPYPRTQSQASASLSSSIAIVDKTFL